MNTEAIRDYANKILAELPPPPRTAIKVKAGENLFAAIQQGAKDRLPVLAEPGEYDGFDLGGLDYQGVIVRPDTSALPMNAIVTAEMAEALIKLRPTAKPYDCALAATGPASNLTFIGVQFLPNPKSPSTAMAILGLDTATRPEQQPDALTFDQCLGLGDPVTGCKRMFMLNTRGVNITRSACDHIFADTDAQAVATVCGPGPFFIDENHWCSAGENFIAGGGNNNTPEMMAVYVEFTGNVCTARPEWRDKARFPKLVRKNAFELKACRKAVVTGNVFENVWPGGGQIGFAIVLTPRSQDGHSPWACVTDVTMAFNLVRHCAGGVNILGTDNENPSQFAERIALSQMLFYDISSAWGGGNGRLFQITAGARDISIDRITADKVGNSFLTLDGAPIQRLALTNSILPEGQYGIKGSGVDGAAQSWAAFTSADSVLDGNIIHVTTGARPLKYPGTTNPRFAPGVSVLGPDYRLLAAGVGYGCDLDALRVQLPAGVAW